MHRQKLRRWRKAWQAWNENAQESGCLIGHIPGFLSMETHHHYHTVARAIEFLRDSQPRHPRLEEVASHVHLSKFHFQRVFKEWAGVSPKEFLQYLTVESAKLALKQGQSTLETAYETGLSGTGRLHDLFVKMEGCTPGDFKLRGRSLELHISEISTPFGSAAIAETERGICRMSFAPLSLLKSDLNKDYPYATLHSGALANGKKAENFFKDWQLPESGILLDLDGTDFQFQVWRALLHTTPPSLLTYRQLAERINQPNGSRAVGSAVGKNPVAYLIPCHRVILSNGHWGGYRWDSERKMAIHAYEQLHMGN